MAKYGLSLLKMTRYDTIQCSEKIMEVDVFTKRPGIGLRPSIIGSYARGKITADRQIQLSMCRFDREGAE